MNFAHISISIKVLFPRLQKMVEKYAIKNEQLFHSSEIRYPAGYQKKIRTYGATLTSSYVDPDPFSGDPGSHRVRILIRNTA